MAKASSFRVGKVRADLRGKVWYLTYHENGRRLRPRVGSDRDAARQMAAQVNAQLEVSAPTAFSFESIRIDELQRRWLDHHEQVLRSSVHTVRRYRTATQHLLDFVARKCPGLKTSQVTTQHAEQFVRYLRSIRVTSNGHPNTRKRPLLDNGVRYILETCRSMFGFAARRRHLSPYAENPFSMLDLDRMPVEDARPIVILNPEQERRFLDVCDDWQFPVFLTLMLTGLRPGELTHLLLPDDVDLEQRILRVRNKPHLGWQVKTRNERDIPLVPVLVDVLREFVGARQRGPLVVRRGLQGGSVDGFPFATPDTMRRHLEQRVRETSAADSAHSERALVQSLSRGVWRDVGAVRTDRIRHEFMRLTRRIGRPELTAPKSLRHLFATGLQDGNVDPLIRCEIMGHATGKTGGGLGMTANYTHTRPETKRKQLEGALAGREAVAVAHEWLRNRKATGQ
jgi:integrase